METTAKKKEYTNLPVVLNKLSQANISIIRRYEETLLTRNVNKSRHGGNDIISNFAWNTPYILMSYHASIVGSFIQQGSLVLV